MPPPLLFNDSLTHYFQFGKRIEVELTEEPSKRKMGRPTVDPKSNQYRIRLSDKEVEMLDYCCKMTNLSKSDIVRQGIGKIYSEIQETK